MFIFGMCLWIVVCAYEQRAVKRAVNGAIDGLLLVACCMLLNSFEFEAGVDGIKINLALSVVCVWRG